MLYTALDADGYPTPPTNSAHALQMSDSDYSELVFTQGLSVKLYDHIQHSFEFKTSDSYVNFFDACQVNNPHEFCLIG